MPRSKAKKAKPAFEAVLVRSGQLVHHAVVDKLGRFLLYEGDAFDSATDRTIIDAPAAGDTLDRRCFSDEEIAEHNAAVAAP